MSRISRLVSGVGVLLVLLGAAGTPAEADAIYTVDRIVANPFFQNVTGELVTDGTFGTVGSQNVVDWSLTIEGVGTATLLGPLSGLNSQFIAAGPALTATPDGLYFDFSQVGSILWVTNSGLPHVGFFWCLDNIGVCNSSSGENIGSNSSESFRGWTGVQKIATLKSTDDVEVPEPASVLLVAGGLLGFAQRHRRVRRAGL